MLLQLKRMPWGFMVLAVYSQSWKAKYVLFCRLQGLAELILDTQVLEEELSRVQKLLRVVSDTSLVSVRLAESARQALNNQDYPHLRQAATSALVKAHRVLQDENRLFDLLGGLTKSQIHLCTYLFAKDTSAR